MQPRSDHDLLPDLDPGDTLLVVPDVGKAYRAEVRGIDHERERAKVHVPGVGLRWFDRDELEAFDAAGDVLVDPDADRPEPEPPPPSTAGGTARTSRYGTPG